MSLKKILQENSADDIAESILLPEPLTAKQKAKADDELEQHRRQRREMMTDEERLKFRLAQLKFKLENYISKGEFEPAHHFGYYLDQYRLITGRKKKELADDIQIHQTQLSNILKNRREPNESLMIRLEIHSRNAIPAVDWYRLHEMGKEYQIKTDQKLRERERKYVRYQMAGLK